MSVNLLAGFGVEEPHGVRPGEPLGFGQRSVVEAAVGPCIRCADYQLVGAGPQLIRNFDAVGRFP